MSTNVTFGKHKGKSLPQVLFHDPDWFFWAIEKDIFDRHPGLLVEAIELNFKARNIKIPKANPEEWLVRYLAIDGKFADFDIIKPDWPDVYDDTFRYDRIDLSVPRRLKGYDKLGCRMMIKKLKRLFFGIKNVRRTRQRCEAFFDNRNNFLERVQSPLPQPAHSAFEDGSLDLNDPDFIEEEYWCDDLEIVVDENPFNDLALVAADDYLDTELEVRLAACIRLGD